MIIGRYHSLRKVVNEMKKLLLILILTGGLSALEIQTDKVAHLGIGYITADVVQSLKITGDKTIDNVVLPLSIVLIEALVKDAVIDSHYDQQDVNTTLFGAVLKVGVKYTIQW